MSTQVVSVVPIVGRLGLPVKFAASGAEANGPSRTASSQTVDLGLLGTLGIVAISGAPTLTKLGIPASQFTSAFKLPPASVADARGEPVADGSPVFPAVPLGPVTVGGGRQHAEAPEGGTAIARTELGDATADFGLLTLRLAGGVSETTANPAQVSATTSLGELAFEVQGARVATLRGVVWHFEQALGQSPIAWFSIGSASFGTTELKVPDAEQLHQLMTTINGLLATTGASVTLPEPRPEGGLTPLRVAFVDSEAGGRFAQPIYDQALSRAVNQAEASVVGGVPESGLAVTVANVVFAALTGRGGFAVEFGDITGSIATLPIENYSYAPLPAPGSATPIGGAATSTSVRPSPSSPVSAPSIPSSAASLPRRASTAFVAAIADETVPGVLIVLAGLGAAGALAATDRRRINAFFGGRP